MTIEKIVSGGQTGADRGGLDAAIHCDLPYGGWVPKHRKAEDGVIPAKYCGLRESPSPDYLARTEANVEDSDATVVFCYGPPAGGSARTVDFAAKHRRPCLAVDLDLPRDEMVSTVVRWLATIESPASGVLNVAGSRASKAPQIGITVMVRLVDVISAANHTLFYPLSE